MSQKQRRKLEKKWKKGECTEEDIGVLKYYDNLDKRGRDKL